ncbi:MAG: c-type cytochrome [Thermodesulfobacteriota bacterium]
MLTSGLLLLQGCGERRPAAPQTGGDPERGRALVRAYGCATCHLVPGVSGARGLAGPPLEGFATRVYIAGTLPNTPDNLVRWVEDPRALVPRTAMPSVGVSEDDARHIAAYLYTLR